MQIHYYYCKFQKDQMSVADSPSLLGLKKQQASSMSMSNLNKSKVILPSRYGQPLKNEKSGFHEVLSSIQTQIVEAEQGKPTNASPHGKSKRKDAPIQNELKRNNSSSLFKIKPMKRQQNNMVQYKEIFINQREQTLTSIQKLSFSPKQSKPILHKYEKLLKFQRGESTKSEESEKLYDVNVKENYKQAIQLLQSERGTEFKSKKLETDYFNNLIVMQLPVFDSVTASGPNSAYSPSLPSNYQNFKDFNTKELLLRAKATTNSEDIEKQSHLSFFLGQAYYEKRMYKQSLKFYRRFLGFAKMMEDKLGMIIGANRVAISHFSLKDYEKSILFNSENLKLSDQDNCFIGLYNIGICYRKLKRYQQAIQYFESCLNWSQAKGEEESECISLGQLGFTYKKMQLFQQAEDKFEESLKICQKIKSPKLKMSNLWNILKLSSSLKIKSEQQIIEIAEDAYKCARQLQNLKQVDTLRCNIGILKGNYQFHKHFDLSKQQQEIQQIQQISY